VSLILEALKKLDRDKKAPDRGFLVLGAAPWPAPGRARRLPALLAVIAVVGLVGSLSWLAWRAGRPSKPESGPPSRALPAAAVRPSASPPVPAAAGTPSTRLLDAVPPMAGPAAVKRAPAAGAANADAASSLQLQAIGERDGQPVAVLSSRLVHEGDHFDGVTVVRIGADEVEIEVQGRRRTLRF